MTQGPTAPATATFFTLILFQFRQDPAVITDSSTFDVTTFPQTVFSGTKPEGMKVLKRWTFLLGPVDATTFTSDAFLPPGAWRKFSKSVRNTANYNDNANLPSVDTDRYGVVFAASGPAASLIYTFISYFRLSFIDI